MRYYSNQEEVPFSGRKRFSGLPASMEVSIAHYVHKPEKVLPADHPLSVQVARIGKSLVDASGHQNLYEWEFMAIDKPVVNAFTSFGGKIYVYTGLVPLLRDEQGHIEDGLAAVLGHEIGHALARHVSDRTALSLLGGFVMQYVSLPDSLLHWIYAIGLELPYSRSMEEEADFIGFQLMLKACYNPQAAFRVESKLEEMVRGKEPPKYLNDHPPEIERVAKLQEWLPPAMEKYAEKCGKTKESVTSMMDFIKSKLGSLGSNKK